MSAGTTGIIVVDRLTFLAEIGSRGGIGRSSTVGLPDNAVFRKYRGFDGVVWPEPVVGFDLSNGLAPVSSLNAVRRYVSTTPLPENCDILLITDGTTEPFDNRTIFQFLGFEVGYFESEASHFSSILNEVIYGIESEMTAFGQRLNASLLLDSRAEVLQLLTIRAGLRSLGADLEEGESFQGYAVYCLK